MPSLNLHLRPCSLSDLSPLVHRFSLGTLPRSGHPVLVVQLEGEASNQTEGAYDLASAVLMSGLEAWDPAALILDLRALAYTWGDRMQNVLDAPQRWYTPLYPLRGAFSVRLPERFPLACIGSA